MDFSKQLNLWPETRVRELIRQATPDDVKRAISSERLTPQDLAVLLSPQAASALEDMALVANRLTRSHFGRTIGLYAPIYLSNVCNSDCVYCGYAVQSGEEGERRTLVESEIRAECEALAGYGFQSVLLLTGDAPRVVPIEYLARSVEIAREYFVSVSVEVYSLTEQEYEELVRVGLDGVTMYMETYHRETYAKVHLRGRKKDFDYRLGAVERAGKAGARRLGVGALLGLYRLAHGRILDGAARSIPPKELLAKRCLCFFSTFVTHSRKVPDPESTIRQRFGATHSGNATFFAGSGLHSFHA